MKILAIGCLHGKVPSALKTFCEKNKVEAVLCCGDLAEESEIRNFEFQNWGKIGEHVNKGLSYQSIVNAVIGKLKWKEMQNKAKERGMHVIKELAKLDMSVYWIHGNHDDSLGKKSLRKVKYSDRKTIKIGKLKILFWSNYTGASSKPHIAKKDNVSSIRWNQIAVLANKRRAEVFDAVRKTKPDVIVVHEPPYDTEFDLVVNEKSPMNGVHIGDAMMYEVIKDLKPKMVICAHMHEHWGTTKLDKTIVICTGYGHDGQAVLLDLPSLKAKKVQI